jgi:hypothetical protein
MTASLTSALKSLPQVRVGRIVCGEKGEPVAEAALKHGVYRMCKKAGLRERSWHSARHYPERRIIPRRPVHAVVSGLDEKRTRDNQRPSRKVMSASPGRYRPGLCPEGEVRARALSLSFRSACR